MGFVVALIALAVMCLIVFYGRRLHHGGGHGGPHGGQAHKTSIPAHRLVEMSKFVFSFCFAWCVLTGSTWICMIFQNEYGWTHIWMEVLEALIMSFVCVVIIWLLDKVADLDETGDDVDECIRDSVLAFGVLIGFCWEHAFDIGVVSISARFDHIKEIAQLCMCITIALIVIPAYVMYIVPVQFRMEEKKTTTPRTSPRIEGTGTYEPAGEPPSSALPSPVTGS